MLKEEQAAELLRRCEKITGRALSQIRGNLKNSESRAAAIWELIVIEALSDIGMVEYEPDPEGSPDIFLTLPDRTNIWIEAAFLYPRFWKEERLSETVADWVFQKAKHKGIPLYRISYRFDGDSKNKAGPVRKLPPSNQKKTFLNNPELELFFKKITTNPQTTASVSISGFSIELFYDPSAKGPYLSGGGLVQESPKTIKEHAVYRVLKEKAKKHKKRYPKIICIGSDQSPALSIMHSPRYPTVRDAVREFFKEHSSVSGVLTIKIESSLVWHSRFERYARSELFLNTGAKIVLTEKQANCLLKINFNRWKYTYPMEKWDQGNVESRKRVGGSLTTRINAGEITIEVPANIVIDSLAGKTNLLSAYEIKKDELLSKYLQNGCMIKACCLKDGDIESGEAPKVVLTLSPPHDPVFWPPK